MCIRTWLVRLLGVFACVASAPAVAQISFVSASSATPTANTTSLVLSVPAGVQSGDLLLAQVVTNGSATFTTPSGWTALQTTSNGLVQGLFYRFATASETGTVTWTWSGNRRAGGGIAVYRGVDSSQAPGAAVSASNTSGNPTAPAQTVVDVNSLLVAVYAFDRGQGTLTATGSMNTAYARSSTQSTGVTLLGSYEQRPAPGSTGTRVATSSDNARNWIAHSLLLRPLPISNAALLSWRLDEASWTGASGEVLDNSGNALHGTVINAATTANTSPALPQVNAQGTCGYGTFSGAANQYVQRADNNLLDLQGSFTIGAWVKPRTLPSSGLMSILSKDENYEFHLNPNGTINWWWQTTGNATNQFNSSTAVPVGQWSHVLIRYAPGDQRIYINGSLAGQASFSGTPQANNDPLQLGADQGQGSRYFNGELDEVRIFASALTEAQISALVAERHACAVSLQCFSDNFDDGILGNDWAVASRGATSFTPTVTAARMRLTSNQVNVSTASTLQRLFPAAGNFIQVQFKYYAYNGSGADGVAVVLSDATVTPQPGAFGGPLGYGTRGDAANPGFAGGWLGVGLDEYGNFSVEGGDNPQQQRPDSVAIRGSGNAGGTSGYRYIAGTPANLNPEVDSPASSAAAPGHTYRITVDGRFSNEARVTVERDTGSGFVVLPNLNAVNVLAAANQQAALPEDFYLSLTGSTGGSTNIHELDDLQVCATTINPIGQQIDHFEFSYSPNALTCNPQPVAIRACADASCSSLFNGPVRVTLSPDNYWTATPPATVENGKTLVFSGGSAQAQLRVPTVGTVVIDDLSSVPVTRPNSQTVCSTAGCQISYANSGLLLQVPNMLAAKPTAATLSAVRKADNALQCVPAFANVTRSVSFTSAYSNPNNGSQPVVVNGSSVGAAAVSLALDFDATGTAPLTVRYDDAGEMKLSARYQGGAGSGDDGLVLDNTATDDLFISKPYGLCLQTASLLTPSTSCNDASCSVFPGGIRAGDNFPLTIRAVGWQADGEALTATQLCNGNVTTPNFRLANIGLSSAVVAPSGGINGTVAPDRYNHALGNATLTNHSVSEVGVFTITATPPTGSYLDGEAVSGGSSEPVGRFIPAFLSAQGSASLTTSCGSAFSYQGQPIGFANDRQPTLTVTAMNRNGGVTTNYDRGAFWKLAAPAVGAYSSITGIPARDERLTHQGTASLEVQGADNGDGARTYRWTGEQLLYTPAITPSSDDYPFDARIRQTFLAASLREDDQGQAVCHGSGCQDFNYDFTIDTNNNLGSQVRLGRLRLGNAHGSELQGLGLPVVLESWQAGVTGSFQPEGLDTCTTAVSLGAAQLDQFSGHLAAGETTASLAWPLDPAQRQVLMSAPGNGNDGSVQVSFPSAPSWLQYPWDGATRSAARGLASFGIYKGSAPVIYRRELYR